MAVRDVRRRGSRRGRHPRAGRGAGGRPAGLAGHAAAPAARRRGAPGDRPEPARRRTRPGRRRPGLRPAAAVGRLGPPHGRARSRAARRPARQRRRRRAPRAGCGPAPGVVGAGSGRRVGGRPPGTTGRRSRGPGDAGGDRGAGVGVDPARHGAAARAPSTPTRWRHRSARSWAGWSPPGADQAGPDVGPSVRWLGRVGIWAVELTARGAMVPLLRQRAARRRHQPRLDRLLLGAVDPGAGRPESARVASRHPCRGRVLALDPNVDGRALTRSALTGMVDAICRDSARRLEVPAPPPRVRTASDVAEAFLARLDGSAFDAPLRLGGEIVARSRAVGPLGDRGARAAGRAARSARRAPTPGTSRCSPPAPTGGSSRSSGRSSTPAPSNSDYEDETARLERMLPALLRPGCRPARRGDPEPGRGVGADGRPPAPGSPRPGSTCEPPPCRGGGRSRRLRVLVDDRRRSRWSARTSSPTCAGRRCSTTSSSRAADIARLAKEARPLIRSGGRWVAIDQADLSAAAEALAERAATTQLSGAEMLRLALGLEGSPLAGGISVGGGGWAADLLDAAAEPLGRLGADPGRASSASCAATRPRRWPGSASSTRSGSAAASRSTWASARRRPCWPTSSPARDPARRWSSPRAAVVGNWAAEAARFTPDLRVVVHHGANRASADEIAAEVARRRRGDHHLRHRGARRRRHRRRVVGSARPRRGAGDQEPGQRDLPAAAPDPGRDPHRAHRHADRERARRPVGDPRLHQPRPGRAPTAVHRPAVPRRAARLARRPRTRCGPSTASSCSAAPRPSPRSPPSCPTRSTSSTAAR